MDSVNQFEKNQVLLEYYLYFKFKTIFHQVIPLIKLNWLKYIFFLNIKNDFP